MKDRKPRQPGRFLIETESGSQYHAVLTMADDPEEEGTPLNKATLLKDTTAALYGLSGDAVPDDVFAAIPGKIDKAIEDAISSAIGGGY